MNSSPFYFEDMNGKGYAAVNSSGMNVLVPPIPPKWQVQQPYWRNAWWHYYCLEGQLPPRDWKPPRRPLTPEEARAKAEWRVGAIVGASMAAAVLIFIIYTGVFAHVASWITPLLVLGVFAFCTCWLVFRNRHPVAATLISGSLFFYTNHQKNRRAMSDAARDAAPLWQPGGPNDYSGPTRM